jgi:hypothetical protein
VLLLLLLLLIIRASFWPQYGQSLLCYLDLCVCIDCCCCSVADTSAAAAVAAATGCVGAFYFIIDHARTYKLFADL